MISRAKVALRSAWRMVPPARGNVGGPPVPLTPNPDPRSTSRDFLLHLRDEAAGILVRGIELD